MLAHPAKYKLSNLKLEEMAKDFAAAGGDALEVVSGRQNAALRGAWENSLIAANYSHQLALIFTGQANTGQL